MDASKTSVDQDSWTPNKVTPQFPPEKTMTRLEHKTQKTTVQEQARIACVNYNAKIN